MVSRKIQDLSQEDLLFLENLLGQEFARLNEYEKQFESKNHYKSNSNKKAQALRLMNAIASQRKLLTMPKW
jgi:hypothetical protein